MLLAFVPNFNTTSDENGFIDQSSMLQQKDTIAGLQNITFTEK